MAGDNLQTSQSALHALIDQLDADDRLGLVTFGNKAKRAEKLTVMDEKGRDRLHRAVDELSAGGSTAMEHGLSEALDELDDPRGGSVSPRVFLLTDALPNVGETEMRVRVDEEFDFMVTLAGAGECRAAESPSPTP